MYGLHCDAPEPGLGESGWMCLRGDCGALAMARIAGVLERTPVGKKWRDPALDAGAPLDLEVIAKGTL